MSSSMYPSPPLSTIRLQIRGPKTPVTNSAATGPVTLERMAGAEPSTTPPPAVKRLKLNGPKPPSPRAAAPPSTVKRIILHGPKTPPAMPIQRLKLNGPKTPPQSPVPPIQRLRLNGPKPPASPTAAATATATTPEPIRLVLKVSAEPKPSQPAANQNEADKTNSAKEDKKDVPTWSFAVPSLPSPSTSTTTTTTNLRSTSPPLPPLTPSSIPTLPNGDPAHHPRHPHPSTLSYIGDLYPPDCGPTIFTNLPLPSPPSIRAEYIAAFERWTQLPGNAGKVPLRTEKTMRKLRRRAKKERRREVKMGLLEEEVRRRHGLAMRLAW